jgi:hypothetical protein
MLPKEYSGDKETWRRKWRAKQKQVEVEDGQGADTEPGDPESEDVESRDGEAKNSNA